MEDEQEQLEPRLGKVARETFIDIMQDPSWFINGGTWNGSESFGLKNWRTMNWFVFDTETTGFVMEDEWQKLPKERFGICQFFGRLLINRATFSTVAHLLNPTIPIEEQATKAHKITDEMVASKPTFAEVAEEILEPIYSADLLVAYNARFDIHCMIYELCCLGWTKEAIGKLLNIPFLDILVFERERKEKSKMSGNKLHDICKRFGVKTMGAVAHGRASLHDAETDTDSLINLLDKFAPNLPWPIRDLVDIQSAHMATQDEYFFKKYGPKEDK